VLQIIRTVTPRQKSADPRSNQLRCRVNDAEKEHLEQAARDAGFLKNGKVQMSEYVRSVLLAHNAVFVGAADSHLVLIPAATASAGEQVKVQELLSRVLALLQQEVGDTPVERPGPETRPEVAVAAPPLAAPADQLAAVAAQTPPGGTAPAVGTSDPRSPVPPLDDPSAVGAAVVDSGPGEPPPTPMETCMVCGGSYPAPIGTSHPRSECQGPGATMRPTGEDTADLTAADIEPDPNPPLGPPRTGESYPAFHQRRVAELARMGRMSTVASKEADAEWRAAHGGGAPATGIATAPPTPLSPRPCIGGCGTVLAGPGVCPTCRTQN
jgi:hypothetical protein